MEALVGTLREILILDLENSEVKFSDLEKFQASQLYTKALRTILPPNEVFADLKQYEPFFWFPLIDWNGFQLFNHLFIYY